jgi:cation diffusion facilitator CzcD-associated flavoprotein CzcO
VTIIPVVAQTAAHVTMLQRSPTYVISLPSQDKLANWLRRFLPVGVAFTIARWRNVLLGLYFYSLCRRKPDAAKKMIAGQNRQLLGDDYDIATHFTPRYNPWEQRLCIAPDADFFDAIKAGKAEVVTDQIETFTETGIRLRSGRELAPDIIVTATGLKLQILGGINVAVDGRPVNFAETMNFKGTLFSDVPNLASVFGYTNASWTLKSDLICAYVSRLINYMDRHDYVACIPRRDPAVTTEPWLDFSSGYIQRVIDQLPRQGSKKPWKLHQNYVLDTFSLRFGKVDDSALEFVPRRAKKKAA